MIKDMTSGNPTRLILTFAFPLLLGNIFQQLYNISDIIIVGRLLGVNALAAAGASAPIVNTLLLVTLGFTAGLCVITAQRFGAKDENGVRKSVTHSIVASIVMSCQASYGHWETAKLRFISLSFPASSTSCSTCF